MVVAGVDGCPGGWIVAELGLGSAAESVAQSAAGVSVRHDPTVERLLADVAAGRVTVVCLDMPIGLPDTGRRVAEAQARDLLGPRRSSVFLSPPRSALDHLDDYPAASAASRRDAGVGLSKQAFHLLPKVAEVDAALAAAPAEVADRVWEAHPELAFRRLLGRPARHPKRIAAGVAERLLALEAAGLDWRPHLVDPPAGGGDDVIDALALALTAGVLAAGGDDLLRCGTEERDRLGRRMQIVG